MIYTWNLPPERDFGWKMKMYEERLGKRFHNAQKEATLVY